MSVLNPAEPYATVVELGLYSMFLIFAPYAFLSLQEQHISTLSTVYDYSMVLAFGGVIGLAGLSNGLAGVAYLGVGFGMALAFYGFLIAILLLVLLLSILRDSGIPLRS